MPEKFEGGTPPQEDKKSEPINFGEMLPKIAQSTGRSIEGLRKTFGKAWYEYAVDEELLKGFESTKAELREWVEQAENGGYSNLEEGKSKSDDYEAAVDTLKAHQFAEVLKLSNPDYNDPAKIEKNFNEHEKEIQKLEEAGDEASLQAIEVLLILRNAEAYLLGKEIRHGEL